MSDAHGHDHSHDHGHDHGHGAAAVAHAPGYLGYWIAWGLLLILTLVMINIHSRNVLLMGISMKSIIICWWFMHLKHESKALVFTIFMGGLGFVLFFFWLMYYEAAKLALVH